MSPGFAGCPARPTSASELLGYRDANHPRPMPIAATLVPTSISTALCGPESNGRRLPNQRSPRAINNGPNRSGRLLAIRRGRSAQSVCHWRVGSSLASRFLSPRGATLQDGPRTADPGPSLY